MLIKWQLNNKWTWKRTNRLKCKGEDATSVQVVFITNVLQESFEGQMTEDNIEVGICNEAGFRRLTPAEVKDYLAAIA